MRKNKKNTVYPGSIISQSHRIEDRLDLILSEVIRLHIRQSKLERLRQESLMDSGINRIHASAIRMKKMAEKEYQTISELYGAGKEVRQ